MSALPLKPRLRATTRGEWRARASDENGTIYVGQGDSPEEAYLKLARSFRNGTNEVSQADPSRLFPGLTELYNPSVLVSRRGLEIYDRMRIDDQVKAALTLKKQAVIQAGWRVDTPEEEMPDDWPPKVLVEESFKNLGGGLEKALVEVLTGLDYGYSVTEKVFEEGDLGVMLSALKTRRPHEFTFVLDEHGNVQEIVQMASDGRRTLPRDKFLVYVHQSEFGNPYGRSDLEAAYRAWWSKEQAYKWLAMLLERYGIPPIIAKYRAGTLSPKQIDAIKDVLANLQAATAGVVPFEQEPDDVEFWSPRLAGQATTVFEPALAMYNADIARALLMPDLLGMTPTQSVGSFARASIIFNVFMSILEHLRREIERLVNDQIVKPLVAMNFSPDRLPTWHLNPLNDPARAEIFETWVKLVEGGAVKATKSDERHIREVLDFPPPDESGEAPPGPEIEPNGQLRMPEV